MNGFRKALLVGGMLIGGIAAAHADSYGTPVSGIYNIYIWQGMGDGTSTAAIEQANLQNPLFENGNAAVAYLTYTGPLDFNEGGNGVNSIAAFLQSGGGSYTIDYGSLDGRQLSTGPFGLTTLFAITGTGTAGQTGFVSHDDGASLYEATNDVPTSTVFDSASPTVDIPSAYTLTDTGEFGLLYVEANDLPADLTMTSVPTDVPEPGSLALLVTGLLGLGLGLAYRRRLRG